MVWDAFPYLRELGGPARPDIGNSGFRLRCLDAGWTLYKGFRIRLVIVSNVFVLVFHGYAQISDKQGI